MARLSPYLKEVNDSYIFTGNKLKVYIPERYQVHKLLTIEDVVSTLGIFKFVINNTEEGHLVLPAVIKMAPSKISTMVIDEITYKVLEFEKGDTFMITRTLLQRQSLVYTMFVEFLANGRMPKINYEDSPKLFELAQIVCGLNLRVARCAFDVMYATCYRDADNPSVPYRLTNMKKPPVFLKLRDTTYGTDSTTAKLVGAYMSQGIDSAIVNPSTEKSSVEDMLRR